MALGELLETNFTPAPTPLQPTGNASARGVEVQEGGGRTLHERWWRHHRAAIKVDVGNR